MNEYTSMSSGGCGTADYNRKPPSPSPRRRTPVHMSSSPAPPRRTSPSPVAPQRRVSPPSFRSQSPPRKRSPSPKFESYNQSNQAGYYSKYASSSYSTTSGGGPASFPTCPSPSPASRGPSVQTPPKKVDDLMTELSEFDPSISHTPFSEPSSRSYKQETKYTLDEDDFRSTSQVRREPSPVKPAVKQPSTPGPAVYYPPGELFSSTRLDQDPPAVAGPRSDPPAGAATGSMEVRERGRAKVRAEYGYKEKGRYSEGESKQGAAVVPICLPLCCAAPCVIL